MSSARDNRSVREDLRALIGKAVTLTISDPWDFGTTHGNGPFPATVVDVTPGRGSRGGALLVRLVEPIAYQGNVCEYLIATPRSQEEDLEKLNRDEGVSCGFVSISPQGAKSTAPFDLTWWRGWGTLLGVIHSVQAGEPVR